MDQLTLQILGWYDSFTVQIILSVLLVGLYFLLHSLAMPRLQALVDQGALKNNVLKQAITIFSLLNGVTILAIILLVWGFNFEWLFALASGILAITGVALFASWSILSNITAFIILLVHQAYRRGNFIRIIEADNYVEGYISEINMFSTTLISENREYIVYPNNLLIARPTIINPKVRFSTIGKIQEFVKKEAVVDAGKDHANATAAV